MRKLNSIKKSENKDNGSHIMIRSFKNIHQKIPISSQDWRVSACEYDKLVVEIGAGAGYHCIQYAKSYPRDFIVAIERTLVKSQKMLGRVENHPCLKNIYPVCGDAIPWICENIEDEEVDRYIILYPNPYPKSSQANKRFINMPFMVKLIKTLKPSGTILFATNILSYYQEVVHVAKTNWSLNIIEDRKIPNDYPGRSHFEKKYLERGEDCFEVILQK